MNHMRRIILLACLGCLPWKAHALSEDEVKAAFVYNFTLFADWGEPAGSQFTICSLGVDSVVPHLASLSGKTVRGARLQISTLEAGESAKGCQVLYIASSQNMRSALALASGSRALTVADGEPGLPTGAMITLQQEGSRVQFAVNLDALRKANITLSSKLLKLARIVE